MAQSQVDQEEVYSAILLPEEKQISASFKGIPRITVKKIRSEVFVIIQDEEGIHHMINADVFKAVNGFYESIILLISIAERF